MNAMKNKKEYYIEDTYTGTTEELASLFLTGYSEEYDICNPAFLKWQYFDNPNGNAVIVSTRDKITNELGGVYIVNPIDLMIDGQRVKAALSLNTFIREDFRGLGLFTKTAQKCYEQTLKRGIDVVIGFPNNNSYHGFVKKLSFADIGQVNYLIKPLNLIGTLQNRLFKNNKIPKINIPEKQLTEGFAVIKYHEQLDAKITSFFNIVNDTHQFTTARDLSYLKWRYINHPSNDYHIHFIEKNGTIYAMIIVALDPKNSPPSANLADFCALNNHEQAASTLLGYTSKILKKSGIFFIKGFAQPLTTEYQILKKQRFFKKEKLSRKAVFSPFIYRNLSQNQYDVSLDNWHIVMGDCDVA